MVSDSEILNSLHQLSAYNDACFRPGQLEAIRTVVNGHKALVVQKTGWGKSLVYFLSTRIFRNMGRGLTIVVSPLLALMDNQIKAAEKFGLTAKVINSQNEDEWGIIDNQLRNNQVDVLFVAPERFKNEKFMSDTFQIIRDKIGLMVIDEAHCISDWGHDFRLDYMSLAEVVKKLPVNVALLATTATANDRVVADIEKQLGSNVTTIRGDLSRDSLYIQIIKLPTTTEKLAWLAENIKNLPMPGVIYCSTHGDCRLVTNWLTSCDVKAQAYYSDDKEMPAEKRKDIEDDFAHDKLDVLVATCAFGMGYDKPNIGFVIHFQKPGTIINYYQEIGRAGRGIDKAYAIMLAGNNDDSVTEYFIKSAFPKREVIECVVELLEASATGLSINDLVAKTNFKRADVDKALKFLEFYKDIYKEKAKYIRTAGKSSLNINFDHMEKVSSRKYNELGEISKYIEITSCYMKEATACLNDTNAHNCGHCANCKPEAKLNETVSDKMRQLAEDFLKSNVYTMDIKKRWPVRVDGTFTIREEKRLKGGVILSNYGDSGWGALVKEGKYPSDKSNPHFSDALVNAAAKALQKRVREWNISCIVAMPSCSQRHGYLVPEFAERLSAKLQLKFVDAMVKNAGCAEQKDQNNSVTQYNNANVALKVARNVSGNVLLVDDMIDSGWSFAVAASKLVDAGASGVYGFALANTGVKK